MKTLEDFRNYLSREIELSNKIVNGFSEDLHKDPFKQMFSQGLGVIEATCCLYVYSEVYDELLSTQCLESTRRFIYRNLRQRTKMRARSTCWVKDGMNQLRTHYYGKLLFDLDLMLG